MEVIDTPPIDVNQKYRILNWLKSFDKKLLHLFDNICRLSHDCYLSEEWKSGVFMSEIVALMISGDKQLVKQVSDKNNIHRLVLAGTEYIVKSRAQV